MRQRGLWAIALSAAMALSVVTPTQARVQARDPLELRSRTTSVPADLNTAICGRAPRLTLDLFDDVRLDATASDTGRSPNLVTWNGTVTGSPDTLVLLSATDACGPQPNTLLLSGSIMLNGRAFRIVPAGPGRITIAERMTDVPPETGTDEVPDPPSYLVDQDERPAPTAATHATCTQGAAVPTIDLLAVTTPAAAASVGGLAAMRSRLSVAQSLANRSYSKSGVKARLRIVHVALAEADQYSGPDVVSATVLGQLQNPGDGVLDDAHTLREKYGADLVALVLNGGTGVGYTPGPPSSTPTRNTSYMGFNAVNIDYLDNSTLTHEIGHNLGATHDWVTEPRNRLPEAPYNHGYFPPSERWSTIMAYSSACRVGRCTRIPYFSNPGRVYQGEAMGVPGDRVDGPAAGRGADNARVLSAYAPAVSDYLHAVDPPELCGLTVRAEPADGGTAQPDLESPYQPGTSVSVEAVPAAGFTFAGWELDGRPAGSTAKTTVAMSDDHTLVARFTRASTPTHTVTAISEPVAGGTVTLNPPGPAVPAGSVVTATAAPASGYVFAGWTLDGAPSGSSPALDVTADADRRLVARFDPAPTAAPTPAPRPAELSVSIASSPAIVVPGRTTVTYRVTVRNGGPGALNGVRLAVTVSGWLSGVSAPGCSVKGTAVTCALGTMAAGSRTFTVKGRVKPDMTGTLSLTARVSSELTPLRTAVSRVSARPSADVGLRMAASRLARNRSGTYIYTVANSGPSTARKVVLLDNALPMLTRYAKVSSRACKRSGSGIRCSWASMAPGQKVVVRLTVRVVGLARGTITNAAVVSASTSDPSRKNNKATLSSRIS